MLWLAEGGDVGAPAAAALDEAYQADRTVWVSPISAWEIGLLVARGRVSLSAQPAAWFRRVLAQPGVALCALDPDMLIDSSSLPGAPPRDPADRIILATARSRQFRILTRDRAILDYARAGHVAALPC